MIIIVTARKILVLVVGVFVEQRDIYLFAGKPGQTGARLRK
jgi:hypothetical protein